MERNHPFFFLSRVDEMSGFFSAAANALGAAKDMVTHSRSRIEVMYNLKVWANACLPDVNEALGRILQEILVNQETDFSRKTTRSFAKSVIISQMLLNKLTTDGGVVSKFMSFVAEYTQPLHGRLVKELSLFLDEQERDEVMAIVNDATSDEASIVKLGSQHSKNAAYDLATLIHQLRLTVVAYMEDLLKVCEKSPGSQSKAKRLVAFNAYVKQLQADATLSKKAFESFLKILDGINDDDPYKKGIKKLQSLSQKSGIIKALASFEKPMALPDEALFSIMRQTSATNDGMRDLEIFSIREALGYSSSDDDPDTPELSDDDDDCASPPVTPPGKRSRKDAAVGDDDGDDDDGVVIIEPPNKRQKEDNQSEQ